MKKYIVTIITFAFSITFFASCKKALTEKMYSAISPSNFYKTATDAEAALNGVFAVLPVDGYYMRTVFMISDLSADIFQPNNANSPRIQLWRGEYTPQNSLLSVWWRKSYLLIKNANDVITNVPNIEMDMVQKNNILGNAYFLRAMAHFDLVRCFGDVPLVAGKNGENELFPKRVSADSVYSKIIEDLKLAETNCLHADQIPETKIGRVSSEAATAMLARVYLQRGGTSYAASTDNQMALTQCNKVIAYSTLHPNVISLLTNYKDVFDNDKKNGPESIFAIQFGEPPAQTSMTALMFDAPSLDGYGSFVALNSFVNAFSANDLRKAVTIGTFEDAHWWISKFHDPGVSLGSEGRVNWMIIRYADVLLMQSEALNDITPSDASKFDGINRIRTRAGLGSELLNFTNTPTPSDFVNALLKERLLELAIEGDRRYDLLRLKKYKEVKAAQGFSIDDNHLLYPIPQADRDVNPNLTQNLGY
ncbi:MAG: RagB/SusD family nutrient uptake outer membrane protein [Ginsengibacter sp.]